MPTVIGPAVASKNDYMNVIHSGDPDTHMEKVDLSGLTADSGSGGEVDTNGVLRPGVPFRLSGGLLVLISGSSQSADGVTIAPIQLAVTGAGLGSVTTTTLGSETGDHFITLGTNFHLNQDAAASNLGRVLSANELASLAAAGITYSST